MHRDASSVQDAECVFSCPCCGQISERGDIQAVSDQFDDRRFPRATGADDHVEALGELEIESIEEPAVDLHALNGCRQLARWVGRNSHVRILVLTSAGITAVWAVCKAF